jgi:hypothetical protein
MMFIVAFRAALKEVQSMGAPVGGKIGGIIGEDDEEPEDPEEADGALPVLVD